MTNNLDTLATALYVKTDDLLKDSPHFAPQRPTVGIMPQLSDAELVALAMMQAMLGYTSEARCCVTLAPTSAACSRTCPSSPVTTSGCARPPN